MPFYVINKYVTKMWISDPGCEPIIIEKVEVKHYCSSCMREMLRHQDIFECPTCHNSYKENEAYHDVN